MPQPDQPSSDLSLERTFVLISAIIGSVAFIGLLGVFYGGTAMLLSLLSTSSFALALIAFDVIETVREEKK